MTPFNYLECPLEGARLIEAGAGTGKTWNISRLALRLILEKGLAVDRVLIVTFTEAATGEIRGRLRGLLKSARDLALKDAGSGDDPDLETLISRCGTRQEAAARLNEALNAFDSAPIHTIHGFCLRVLSEKPFESNAPFNLALLDETEKRLMEVEAARDFFRTRLNTSPLPAREYAWKAFKTPEKYYASAGRILNQLSLRALPAPPVEGLGESLALCAKAFSDLAGQWRVDKEAIRGLLAGPDSPVSAVVYRRGSVEALLLRADVYFNQAEMHYPLHREILEKLSEEKLKASLKKGKNLAPLPFFTRAGEFLGRLADLERKLQAWLNLIKGEFPLFCRERGRLMRRSSGVRSFDDLLTDLEQGLEGLRGAALAGLVRGKYPAALIDEFQDTDPVQYSIFSALFKSGASPLFLIGDPKQAIYGFRGADIHTYLKAAEGIPPDRRHTLTSNFRAEGPMLSAINALFLRPASPFLLPGIRYHKAAPPPPGKSRVKKLLVNRNSGAGLVLWRLEGAGDGKPVGAGEARNLICGAVAAEIQSLLEQAKAGGVRIGDAPLCPGDIAVLVRTRDEAILISQSLAHARVPAVLHRMGNLFESREAWEFLRILHGLKAPSDDGLVRGALCTDVLGYGATALFNLLNDPAAWATVSGRFAGLSETFRREGFMRMFRGMMSLFEVRERLLCMEDGERRLTNLAHLAEVLHGESESRGLDLEGLARFLSRAVHPDAVRSEEHELRLERDDEAVRIITIHKSKGLEYPVVFAPFMWAAVDVKDNESLFHDPADPGRLLYDPAGAAAPGNFQKALSEAFAESLRLLYVTLTRARSRCYLVVGPVNGYERSGAGYLMHSEGKKGAEDPVEIMDAFLRKAEGLGEEAIRGEIEDVVSASQGSITLGPLPAPPDHPYEVKNALPPDYRLRPFSGAVPSGFRIASFSSLSSSRRDGEGAEKDRDRSPALPAEGPASGVFALPGGIKTGLCLHALLEEADFQDPDMANLAALSKRKLSSFGLDESFGDDAALLVRNTLSCALCRGPAPLLLRDLRREDRIHEMEFYHPLRRISPESFSGMGGSALFQSATEKLDFLPLRGYMRGFIDMVFRFEGRYYLLDWKSNHLGNSPGDYAPDRIRAVMAESRYILQYHIYALALDRYLASRMKSYSYERDFGGVYYLFLRGLHPGTGPERGVFFDRPDADFMARLREELIG